ncbi:MAG: histidinol dehydrogenase, partial [Raoultibacter sp.]
DQGIIIVCPDLQTAMDAVNVIAPEHLEVHLDHAFDTLGMIRNAGAIFLGAWTPEAVGDYVAGPNHTLPTGGTARFSSPLSVDEFIKKSSVIQYSSAALANDASAVMAIAQHEGLWAHAKSVELRCNLMKTGTLDGSESANE